MTETLICRFTVPGPPVPKGRPRVTRSGHAYTPERTREAEKRIVQYLKAAYPHLTPVNCFVRVETKFYLPTRRRQDADNLYKTVTDAMNGLVYADDYLIAEAEIGKHHDPQNPRTEVEVYALDARETTGEAA